VDPGSGAPVGSAVTQVETTPNNVVGLQVAVQLDELRVDDIVEVDVLQDGRAFARYRYPVAAFESGWMSVTARLNAPARGNPEFEYEIVIFVNGERVRAAEVEVGLQPQFR
jgi:hypothetical protein